MFFFILFLGVYLLVFPLKIKVYLSNEKIKISLYSLCFLNQEIFQAVKELQEVTIENIQNKLMTKEDLIYLKILRKFKILKLDIDFSGFNTDYEALSILYGFLYGVFSSFDLYFANNDVPFNYKINYSQNSEFKIEGIFKTNLGKILLEYLRLRRIKYGRASN